MSSCSSRLTIARLTDIDQFLGMCLSNWLDCYQTSGLSNLNT